MPQHYFEGVEKRLIVNFVIDEARPNGLRDLPVESWRAWCRHARCSILSRTSNAFFDSYVLSESSLFVYPDHIVAKTCGSTTLLHAVEPLIDLASSVGCEPAGVCFTRSGYNFPEGQVYPHTSFEEEVEYLDETFVDGSPLILGPLDAEKYHMYLAETSLAGSDKKTLEVQMYELDPKAMANFFRGPDGLDGETQTRLSGVDTILPGSTIDSFAFDPCGYSMNGLLDSNYWTIHITPEDHCSYVSFETNLALDDYTELLERVMGIFRPGRVCISLLARKDAIIKSGKSAQPDLQLSGFKRIHTSSSFATDGHQLSYTAFAKDLSSTMLKRSASKSLLRNTVAPNSPVARNRVSGRQNSINGGLIAAATPSLSASNKNTELVQSIMNPSAGSCSASLCASDAAAAADKPVPSSYITSNAAVVKSYPPEVYRHTSSQEAVVAHMKDRIASAPDSFFVIDLGKVTAQYRRWQEELPMVVPHYAVKCNPDPVIVKHLADLGACFDCASEAEMALVLSLGVSPSRIIYANPTRPLSHLRFARAHNVDMLTADNTDELRKIASEFPTSRVLIRIAPLETDAICPLGAKFGATEKSVTAMLSLAKELRLDIAGVAFHVGSGTRSLTSYAATLLRAKAVFNEAVAAGFRPRILDIGGGMPGKDGVDSPLKFADIAATIRPMLKELFDSSAVRIISEPGRFFVADSHTLATRIVARRDCTAEIDSYAEDQTVVNNNSSFSDSEVSDVSATGSSITNAKAYAPRFLYYVADGVYGSFNCLLFDHATVKAQALRKDGTVLADPLDDPEALCTVFGPTCDALDCILERTHLPKMEIGDWLFFETLGAYTSAAATEFNGFNRPACDYINTYSN